MKMISNVSGLARPPAAARVHGGCWRSTPCGGELRGLEVRSVLVSRVSGVLCVLAVMLLKGIQYTRTSVTPISWWDVITNTDEEIAVVLTYVSPV